MRKDVQERQLGDVMNRSAHGFFRLLEGLGFGQLHENHRANGWPGQFDTEITAIGGIAGQRREGSESALKGKFGLDRGGDKSTVR